MSVYDEIRMIAETFDFEQISSQRKAILQPLIDYLQEKVTSRKPVRLNFICTHNSRRSHLSQVWAQTAATYFGIDNVVCYSGGTEATAMYPTVAKTLEAAGFKVHCLSQGANPVYAVKYSDNDHAVIAFSKTYDDAFNPQSEFAAIMTCSQADTGCPFIPGAEKRIAITYDDPKAFDNTAEEFDKYKERSLQIARELFYAFSKITK